MEAWAGIVEGRWEQTPPWAEVEEREWVRRCRQGEEDAFRALMRRYRGRALYLATQILRDATEAEDVVQEAFLRAFRSIRTLRAEARFYSWLYRIVVNLCLDRRRRAAHQATLPLDECRDACVGADQGELRAQVDALLAQLSDELRITLLLRVVAGLSYAEIARETKVPVGTVCSRLSAAREQFRRLWESEEEEAR